MQAEEIEERIKCMIIRTLSLDIAAAEMSSDELLFGGDLSLDSMASMEIIVGLEEEFGIEVGDEDLRIELFDSVRTMADYVRSVLDRPSPHDGHQGSGQGSLHGNKANGNQ
jgi:acyl carrier protein